MLGIEVSLPQSWVKSGYWVLGSMVSQSLSELATTAFSFPFPLPRAFLVAKPEVAKPEIPFLVRFFPLGGTGGAGEDELRKLSGDGSCLALEP